MAQSIQTPDTKENTINLSQPYIVHIKGYNYTSFRQGFHQPYDPTFQYAMVLTMNDLLLAFQACTGYTHMFDIVLVFDKNRTHLNLDPIKLLTIYTSYVTVRFNYHMSEQIHNPFFVHSYTPAKISSVMARQSLFFSSFVQSNLMEYMIRQCSKHALEKTVFLWAQTLLGAEKCQNKSQNELLFLLQEEKSIRWTSDVPVFMSYGVFGKMDVNPKTNQLPGICNRGLILEDSEFTSQWMMAPHWPITLIPQYLGDRIEPKDIFNVTTFHETNSNFKTINTEAAK